MDGWKTSNDERSCIIFCSFKKKANARTIRSSLVSTSNYLLIPAIRRRKIISISLNAIIVPRMINETHLLFAIIERSESIESSFVLCEARVELPQTQKFQRKKGKLRQSKVLSRHLLLLLLRTFLTSWKEGRKRKKTYIILTA